MTTTTDRPDQQGVVLRGHEVWLDPSAAQERLLSSYAGTARQVHNWVLAQAWANLDAQAKEREAGADAAERTPPLSWHPYGLAQQWRAQRDEVTPWHRQTSIHAALTGIRSASDALNNWNDSRTGKRRGRKVGRPKFRSRRTAPKAVTFVEINHQLSWLHEDRRHVRLMLPERPAAGSWEHRQKRRHTKQPGRAAGEVGSLGWIHTLGDTREIYEQVESGVASIQQLVIRQRGGRWVAVFTLRYKAADVPTRHLPAKWHGGTVGVDLGFAHLATLDRPVAGITDSRGHVDNPRPLVRNLEKLRRLDRAVSRAQRGSKNHAKLVRRRNRARGAVAATRELHQHQLTTRLAAGFDVVALEDLNVAAMARRAGMRLGRSVADAGLATIAHQLEYKTKQYGHDLIRVGRFYPSSKTCSACGTAKAKLPLHVRTFDCDQCGLILDRDVNAARNIAAEATRLAAQRDQPPQEQKQVEVRRRGTTGDAKRHVESRQTDRHLLVAAAVAPETATVQPESAPEGAGVDGVGDGRGPDLS